MVMPDSKRLHMPSRLNAIETIKDKLEWPADIRVELRLVFKMDTEELIKLKSEEDLLEYFTDCIMPDINVVSVRPA